MEEALFLEFMKTLGFPVFVSVVLFYDKIILQPKQLEKQNQVISSMRDAVVLNTEKIDDMRRWLEEESRRS